MATDSCGYDIEEVSHNYAKYRPTCPPELYEKILSYLDEGSEDNGRRGLAVDIGCGCGHSTLALATHFRTVIGIDNSETQLKEAMTASAEFRTVFYKLGSAESVSSLVTTDSVDLITVGSAVHWFDIDTFYEECLKILKPRGTLAVYTYGVPVYDNLAANRLLQEFYRETLKDYHQDGVKQYFNGYKEPWALLRQSFEQCIRADSMSLKLTSSIREVIGFIKSIPEYVYYMRDHSDQPDVADSILERLKKIFETNSIDERIVKVENPLVLLLGKKRRNSTL